jgi:hypothetical protein
VIDQFTRDELIVRAAAISTREYLFGYLDRHIPGSAIEALRRRPIQAAMIACVMDGDSVKAALARRDDEPANFGLTVAIQHLNSNSYNLTKDECIALLREVRDGVRK